MLLQYRGPSLVGVVTEEVSKYVLYFYLVDPLFLSFIFLSFMPRRVRDKTIKFLPKSPTSTSRQPILVDCEPPAMSTGTLDALFGKK